MKAALVPAGLVDTCWDEVAPMLERATDRSGGRYSIEEIDSIFRKWALDNGCSGIELTGRKGWVKALEGLGWKPSFVVVEKSYE